MNLEHLPLVRKIRAKPDSSAPESVSVYWGNPRPSLRRLGADRQAGDTCFESIFFFPSLRRSWRGGHRRRSDDSGVEPCGGPSSAQAVADADALNPPTGEGGGS